MLVKQAIKMKIRNAAYDDLEQLNEVVRRAVMTWELPERVKRLGLPSLLYSEIDLQHFVILVAEMNGRIIGVAALCTETEDLVNGTTALLLHGIYVEPANQQSGVGRKLYDALEAIAVECHADALLVKAQKDAVGFYASMGLKKLAVEDKSRDFANRYWKTIG